MRLLLVVICLVACGDGPGDQTIRGEATLETFVNRMCACRDAACTTQVVQDLAHWSKLVKTPRSDPFEARQLMRHYNECMDDANRSASHSEEK